MAQPETPRGTWDCFTCEQTYLAGVKAGPPPFFCHFCGGLLVSRPPGAEPYEPAPGYQPAAGPGQAAPEPDQAQAETVTLAPILIPV